MRNSTKFTLAVFAIALIGFGVYKWRVHSATSADAPVTQSDDNNDDQQSHVEAKAPDGGPVDPAAPAVPPPSADPVNEALIQQKFAAGLKELGTCFNLSGEIADKVEPTLQNLTSFIHADMGDALSSSELWTSTDIQTSSGENRRIRVEMDYGAEENVYKRVKYFTVGAQGQLTALPLTTEQSENASDAFVASLEGDGKVTTRSHGVTAYYPNFAEMEYSEKDGRLMSVEMLMGESGKFTCTNMDNNNIACKCHDQKPPQ